MTVDIEIRMTNIGEYLKGFYLNVTEEEMGAIEFPNTLRDMKALTKAKCIDIGDIRVQGMSFKTIYPATANDNMHISAVNSDGKCVYRGNILIVGSQKDKFGNETLRSLTEDELFLLMANTGLMFVDGKGSGGEQYNAYILCNVKLISAPVKESAGSE